LSIPQIPEPGGVIVSVLASDATIIPEVANRLREKLGPVEEEIGPLEFRFTSYYDRELGQGIGRWIWFFSNLVDRSELVRIKCMTNGLENEYSLNGKRRFNLDPGLLTLGNLVLATGKNNAHRIYLDQGIFADLTLIFRSGSYRPLPWTYPDYSDAQLIEILNRLREAYKCKLKQRNQSATPSTA